jgi:hypothetical protein
MHGQAPPSTFLENGRSTVPQDSLVLAAAVAGVMI